MGLIKALTTWLEADAMVKLATAEAIELGAGQVEMPEQGPEGSFSQVEIGNAVPTEPELHAGWRPSHTWWGDEDRGHISLRYTGHVDL